MTSAPEPIAGRTWRHTVAVLLTGALLVACGTIPAQSQERPHVELGPESAPTYADLVTFALAADLVAIVTVDEQIAFSVERAPDVPPGRVRLYIESLTRNLLAAPTSVGESLIFVTDTNRDVDGDGPDWEGRDFVIFADLVRTRPGEIQLVSSRAMFPAGPLIESRVRQVLNQLSAPERAPVVTDIRDVISIEGNLAGESETQMFVETESGAPVSLTVLRRPGMKPQWGVSLGEIVDTSARPPEPDSLAWFRFACFLPDRLPDEAFLQRDREAQQRAREDYAFVLAELGPCERRYS